MIEACDGSGTPPMAPADAGTDAGDAALPARAELPRIPWLSDGVPPIAPPALTPCPDGWRVVEAAGTSVCEPWPAAGAARCVGGQAHFPGEPGCRTIGSACPAGDFPVGLPTDRPVLYVRPGATGGDGSMTLPFGTLAEALGAAAPDSVIALAKGRFEGDALLDHVTLIGACAAQTIVFSTTSHASEGALTVRGAGVELRDLGIESTARAALVVDGVASRVHGVEAHASVLVRHAGSALEGDELVVRDAPALAGRTAALEVDTGRVALSHVVIERSGTAGLSARSATIEIANASIVGAAQYGVEADSANVDLRAVVVESSQRDGLRLGASTVSVDSSVVRAAGALRSARRPAVIAGPGTTLTMHRTWIDQSFEFALACATATVDAEDVVVTRTMYSLAAAAERSSTGVGVYVYNGHVTLSRVVVADSGMFGIESNQPGSIVDASDVRVLGGAITAPGVYLPSGIFAKDGELTLRRVEISRAPYAGLVVLGPAHATVEDARIADPELWGPDAAGGIGVFALDGASVDLARVLVEGHHDTAVLADGIDTTLRAQDLVARDAAMDPFFVDDHGFAHGLAGGVGVERSAHAEITRALLERNVGIGAAVSGSEAGGEPLPMGSFVDLTVRQTRAIADLGYGGQGLQVRSGNATVLRADFVDNLQVAIWALRLGSTLDLEEVGIAGTRPADCASTTCAADPGGHGLLASGGAVVASHASDVSMAALCATLVEGADTVLDLHGGSVTHSAIGACVQADGYDVARLTDGVTYRDNGANIQTTSFALPTTLDLPRP